MKIITVPHQTLRTVATKVDRVDKKLLNFISDLEKTLEKKQNPKGVGLAAPQVDTKWRIFSTQLPISERSEVSVLRSFINPVILDHSDKHVYGTDPKHPRLEGCLSIPGFYGPVPRWQRLTLQYDYIDGTELKTTQEDFTDFAARVVQHEQDHLEGILFIDHTLRYDLPLYKEDPKTEDLEEIAPELMRALVAKTIQ